MWGSDRTSIDKLLAAVRQELTKDSQTNRRMLEKSGIVKRLRRLFATWEPYLSDSSFKVRIGENTIETVRLCMSQRQEATWYTYRVRWNDEVVFDYDEGGQYPGLHCYVEGDWVDALSVIDTSFRIVQLRREADAYSYPAAKVIRDVERGLAEIGQAGIVL